MRRFQRAAAWVGSCALLASIGLAVPAAQASTFPFQNPNLPLKVRLADLMSRLTLTEKIEFLHQYQPAIPSLGIKAFKLGTEALHGVAWTNDPATGGTDQVFSHGTVFPQAVGLASTWDTGLIKQVGTAVGQDARGYYATDPEMWGLNLWAPVVNLLRNPLWGRNEEGYSEDPYLTGAIGTAYASGMEDPKDGYLLAAPTLKHYLAYNNEVNRGSSSSEVPPRVLQEYDRAPFRAILRADAATGVMASYNEVNGRPNTVNPDMNSVERSWSSRTLMNVTDAGANYNLLPGTGTDDYYPDLEHVDAAAIKAGIDSFTADNADDSTTVENVTAALNDGLLTMNDIDKAVADVLTIRFELGTFNPDGGPYGNITSSVIDDAAHRALARKTADEAMVLLKNSGSVLPLNAAATKKLAVIGPLSNTMYSDWYGGNLPYTITPLDAIRNRLGANGTVDATEGVDRIALKDVSTGKYVTASAASGGGALTESSATPSAGTQFDTFDWGSGAYTLRSVANGKYLDINGNHQLVNDATQPNGWYVQQMFKLDKQPDGSYVLQFDGYDQNESWFGPIYATVGSDGTLGLGATTPAAAAHFTEDVVTNGVDAAVAAAKSAQTAVVVVGSMPFINGREDHDRTFMDLPPAQEALVEAVTKANPNTIVVLEDSYPTTIDWAERNTPAILWTTHGGQEGGDAIADVLFGDANPSGHLTQTWPRSMSEVPSIMDYDIVKSGQTYQYSTQPVLYPFGYGLSYTTFHYSNLRLSSPVMNGGGQVCVSVDLTNTGTRAGAEVVQLYTHQRTSRDPEPIKTLRAFQKVWLQPGQTTTVHFTLKASDLAHWDITQNRWVTESSGYDVMVGSSSADLPERAALEVNGEVIPPRDLALPTQAQNFDDYSSGSQLVDYSQAAGTAVEGTSAGQWIEFAKSGLNDPRTFTASAANAGSSATTLQVRLGSPTGRLIGTATVPPTGSKYTYATVSAPLSAASGFQDVYLVFGGDARIFSFSLK